MWQQGRIVHEPPCSANAKKCPITITCMPESFSAAHAKHGPPRRKGMHSRETKQSVLSDDFWMGRLGLARSADTFLLSPGRVKNAARETRVSEKERVSRFDRVSRET